MSRRGNSEGNASPANATLGAREYIHREYSAQFSAAIALYDFAKDNRPEWPDKEDAASVLLFRT